MSNSLQLILGIIVIIGVIIGFITPLSYIIYNKKTLLIGHGINWKPIIRSVLLLASKGSLIKTENFTLKNKINIIANTYNSAIKINEWRKEFIEVKVFNIEPFPLSNMLDIRSGKPLYSIKYISENNTLVISSHNTYIETYIPEKSLNTLRVTNIYGALSANFSGSLSKNIVVTVKKGGAHLDLRDLRNISININSENSGLDIKLDYGKYSGKSVLRLNALNTLLDIYIVKNVNTKIKIITHMMNSAFNAEYNGKTISKDYVDKGYDNASSKLELITQLNDSDIILVVNDK